MSASDPFSVALRLLTRSERSSADLAEQLRRRGFDAEAIAAALQRCRDFGYLDDGRYARLRTRSLVESGRAVGGRLRQELQRHGIAADLAEAAIVENGGDGADAARLTAQLHRRYPDFSWDAADDRQRRRVVGFFLRRGFPLALVLSVLKQNQER